MSFSTGDLPNFTRFSTGNSFSTKGLSPGGSLRSVNVLLYSKLSNSSRMKMFRISRYAEPRPDECVIASASTLLTHILNGLPSLGISDASTKYDIKPYVVRSSPKVVLCLEDLSDEQPRPPPPSSRGVIRSVYNPSYELSLQD